MNTNSNSYTIIYTTLIVVVVATVLAFVATSLKSKQNANVQAESISQMLTAAGFATSEELAELSNDDILKKYSEVIKTAFIIDANGKKVGELETEYGSIELADNLKLQNTNIKNGSELELPVYLFDKDGSDVYVMPIYGAGLWGPIWGYVAYDENCINIIGAYFDHSGETPGLGAKIKDEPSFREQFVGKKAIFTEEPLFSIVKGGAPADQANAVDAITGATITCKGLNEALNTWLEAYRPFFETKIAASLEHNEETCTEEGHDHSHGHDHDHGHNHEHPEEV